MKKVICFFFYFICSLHLFAQNIAVEYYVKVNKNVAIIRTAMLYKLIIKNDESIYYNYPEDSLNQFEHKNLIVEKKKSGDFTQVKLSDNHYAYITEDIFYKNYSQDTLIFNEDITTKKVIVGESATKLFAWQIIPNQDSTILGYRCQKATAEFKGRKYIAYFNSEINFYGGPWKFDGLPGLILAVKSQDNYFVIEPLKVTLNPTNSQAVENPYKNLTPGEILSWEQYKKKLKQKLEALLKKMKAMSEDGESGSIKMSDLIEDVGFKEISFTK